MEIKNLEGEIIYKDKSKTIKTTLQNAIKKGINLHWADLRGANLCEADLCFANLRCANLTDANLYNSNLRGANLYRADLYGAYLRRVYLCDADLRGANLSGADLTGADLRYANFDDSERIRFGLILTEPMKGYKKCRDGVIVELEIPAGAVVFSINNTKCRTNIAKVIAISEGDVAYSLCDEFFAYRVGEVVKPDIFNMMYNVECSSGIHFFRTRAEAENYL